MKNFQRIKQEKRKTRIRRTRATIFGTRQRPRVAVYRSLRHIYVQLIDDVHGKTLLSASDLDSRQNKSAKKVVQARAVGLAVAEKAVKAKIKAVVFDRRGYRYHGRVRSVAEGLREGGLVF